MSGGVKDAKPLTRRLTAAARWALDAHFLATLCRVAVHFSLS